VRDRLRRFWRRRLGKVIVVIVVAAAVVVGASFAAAAYTERSSFCIGACHEMQPYGDTWEVSAHKDFACVRCHIKPGFIEFVEAKASALREVWVHVTGQVKAPIAVTEHIPNSTCTSCHPADKVKEPLVLGNDVRFSHAGHSAVPLCITCHSQVVHESVPGRPYLDPTTMAYCLQCHDGKQASGACETCHEPPHADRGKCSDCHELGSWKTDFRHPIALGKLHKKLVCEKCHTDSTVEGVGFSNGCIDCHRNRHHEADDELCAKCHVPSYFVPTTFKHPRARCERCHEPPHPDRGACLGCHTRHSWASSFSHPMALGGPHSSFSCEKCHARGVDAPGLGCASCHNPPHSDYGSCLNCHSMSSWASHFSHPIALGGVHASFPCTRCHTRGISSPGIGCSGCHGSQHGGLTDCAQCHTMSGWAPSTFHHPPAGAHNPGAMACTACHPNGNFARSYCSCHGGKPPSGD